MPTRLRISPSGAAFLLAPSGDLVGASLACRRGERLVFAGLSLRLPPGGALLLTGSNGTGKSSLLRLLATLLTPAGGLLSYDGVPADRDLSAYRSLVHYIGHVDATKPALTPREMLGFWAALRGDVPRTTADAALDHFGLFAIAGWPCRWLSAGQRRRLALARLLTVPAPIWLLDEPTAALDTEGDACLLAAIDRHRAAGGRVAIATHQALALDAADTLELDDFAAPPELALAAAW